jgi:hypothetical protein
MKIRLTMREALTHPELFGHPKGLIGPSWEPWRVLLIAMMGEQLTDSERELFKTLTGRDHEPAERVEEFWAIPLVAEAEKLGLSPP